MSRNPALEAALALSRMPALADAMRRQSLPPGVSLLLQIVAGDPAGAAAENARACNMDTRALELAAELYIQQVMLFPNAPSHRVLGVGPADDRAQMRRHMRWLMMWLHPDHNASEWRSAFAARVLAAWRDASAGAPLQANQHPEREARGAGRASSARGAPLSRRGQVRLPWVASPLPSRKAAGKSALGRYMLPALALVLLALWMASPSEFVQTYLAFLTGEDVAEPIMAPVTEMFGPPMAAPPEAELSRRPGAPSK